MYRARSFVFLPRTSKRSQKISLQQSGRSTANNQDIDVDRSCCHNMEWTWSCTKKTKYLALEDGVGPIKVLYRLACCLVSSFLLRMLSESGTERADVERVI